MPSSSPAANHYPSAGLLARHAPLAGIDGCDGIAAHRAPDVFALWDAWEKESAGEREIPYWSVAWPGAVVFARFLLSHPEFVSGRTVLDLGCGSAVASIAAARSGAVRVIANDVDPVALHVAALNAAANGVVLEYDSRDLIEGDSSISADVVLAGDLFYERAKAALQEEFLRKALAQDAVVLVADGERAFAPRQGLEEICQERVPVNRPLEGVDSRVVRLCRMV